MRLKWIVSGLLALVVALVVTGYAMLASLDFEEYRGTLETLAREATGRDLRLAGAIDLRVSLAPAVTVEAVSLGNTAWGSRPEMVRLKRFELEAELLPLLSGELQVKRLLLVEPDILIETDAEGRSNLAFEADEEALAEAKDEKSVAAMQDFLAIDRVAVQGGRLTYRDGASGAEQVLDLEALEAAAEGPDSRPFPNRRSR